MIDLPLSFPSSRWTVRQGGSVDENRNERMGEIPRRVGNIPRVSIL